MERGGSGMAVGARYTPTPPPHPQGRSWVITGELSGIPLTLRADGCDDRVTTVPGCQSDNLAASIRQGAKPPWVRELTTYPAFIAA